MEKFVAKDGNRWFVMQNHDHCDAEGNHGMTTDVVGEYATRAEAEAAI